MQVYQTKEALLAFLHEKKAALGLVPTMGALHAGHLSLVEKAVQENPLTVVSIFVNPTQFNNTNDLKNYPKNLADDLQILAPFANSIVVFAPTVEELYGAFVQTKNYQFGSLERFMEGAARAHHFQGVATVVEKLFTLVQPQKAYFGEKDFQQLQIIKALTNQKQWPIDIIGCPIVREPNGLAMSSRNTLLTTAQREQAALLSETLFWVTKNIKHLSVAALKEQVAQKCKQKGFDLDYFEIADTETLCPIDEIKPGKSYRAFMAGFMGQIRLIDNMSISKI